jgi:hypothetical protein
VRLGSLSRSVDDAQKMYLQKKTISRVNDGSAELPLQKKAASRFLMSGKKLTWVPALSF